MLPFEPRLASGRGVPPLFVLKTNDCSRPSGKRTHRRSFFSRLQERQLKSSSARKRRDVQHRLSFPPNYI